MAQNNENSSPKNNGQFIISYELLQLLQWLIEHDAHKFKKIIVKSLTHGLFDELKNTDDQSRTFEDIQHSIVNFFAMLESILLESINEQVEQRAKEQNLMPALDHVDATVCDDAVLRTSLEKASSKLDLNPQENPKDLLYKEILKLWKPHNKNLVN